MSAIDIPITLKWTERQIGAYLCRHVFHRKCLVVVPNCSWPGSECDLLVVTTDLRVIDVEIKVSRGDLRADGGKDKWFHAWDFRIDGPWTRDAQRRSRPWPRRVWKHYYCLPAEIWTPELLAAVPAISGVLLIRENRKDGKEFAVTVARPAKPCRDCERIAAADALDIARLAGLRMWDAYETIDKAAANNWRGAGGAL